MPSVEIVPMTEQHWDAVREIYQQGIATGDATFEQSVPAYKEWNEFHLANCRLIACWNDKVLGWAALSRVSTRSVYQGVAEVSLYVAEEVRGRGIGRKLLGALVASAEENGIWTLQAAILAENAVSIRLHQQAGFRIVGKREKIGCLQGHWRDVVLMERRSTVVGL